MMPTTTFPKYKARHALRWALLGVSLAAWISSWAAFWLSAAQRPALLPALAAQQHAEVASVSAPTYAPPPARLASTPFLSHAAAIPTPLAWQLRDSDDLMDFIERARFHPASGGFYYALKAYDFCTREAKVSGRIPRLEDVLLPDEPLPDIRRISATLRIATLCRSFAQTQVLPFSYISLIENGQTLGDPKLALAQRLEKLSATTSQSEGFNDPVARAALLNALFATRDPWLLHDLAAELQLIETKITVVIDGEAIAPEEQEAFFAALYVAACELDAACSADDDWYQLLACSQAGKCDAQPIASINDLLLQQRIRHRLLHATGGWMDFVPRVVP